ncbi:hypothetical protein [Halopenitus persicus]|uniref:Uncharacterized protein n=1 Tax=Halopenitus persicus TaxID=1048396 RepID=A0A1H3IZF6_9EURY|nr:hypothetical protein [Halopenitus persicus]SDY32284.1 hypothetical protein SAMN05216564_104296 [Halopenitus persicus]
MSTRHPPERLAEFLDRLERDLGWIVEQRRSVLPGYDETFYGRLADAWPDVRANFDRLRQDLTPETVPVLEDHGLTDSQLDLKLRAIESRRSAVTFVREHWEAIGELGVPVRMRLVGETLRSYFETLQRVLESLLQALGAPGAVAEFKDVVENSIPG